MFVLEVKSLKFSIVNFVVASKRQNGGQKKMVTTASFVPMNEQMNTQIAEASPSGSPGKEVLLVLINSNNLLYSDSNGQRSSMC